MINEEPSINHRLVCIFGCRFIHPAGHPGPEGADCGARYLKHVVDNLRGQLFLVTILCRTFCVTCEQDLIIRNETIFKDELARAADTLTHFIFVLTKGKTFMTGFNRHGNHVVAGMLHIGIGDKNTLGSQMPHGDKYLVAVDDITALDFFCGTGNLALVKQRDFFCIHAGTGLGDG